MDFVRLSTQQANKEEKQFLFLNDSLSIKGKELFSFSTIVPAYERKQDLALMKKNVTKEKYLPEVNKRSGNSILFFASLFRSQCFITLVFWFSK